MSPTPTPMLPRLQQVCEAIFHPCKEEGMAVCPGCRHYSLTLFSLSWIRRDGPAHWLSRLQFQREIPGSTPSSTPDLNLHFSWSPYPLAFERQRKNLAGPPNACTSPSPHKLLVNARNRTEIQGLSLLNTPSSSFKNYWGFKFCLSSW